MMSEKGGNSGGKTRVHLTVERKVTARPDLPLVLQPTWCIIDPNNHYNQNGHIPSQGDWGVDFEVPQSHFAGALGRKEKRDGPVAGAKEESF